MIYDRQEECMRVTLQMHFTHAHLEPFKAAHTLKAAHSTYVSMYCYGRALENNPGPVAGGGSLTDAPIPLSCANGNDIHDHLSLSLSPGCESKGKLKGDNRQRSGLLTKADGGCPEGELAL